MTTPSISRSTYLAAVLAIFLGVAAVNAGRGFQNHNNKAAIIDHMALKGAKKAMNGNTDSIAGEVLSVTAGVGISMTGTEIDVVVNIATGGVSTLQLADGAVTGVKIGAAAVNTDQIADDAVNSVKIADGSIATIDIGDNQVDSAKIADGSIATIDIGDNQVDSAKIADGSIATIDIGDNQVNSAKIADGSIATIDIGDNQVDSAKIADGSIATIDIGNGQVTNAKLQFDDIDFTAGAGITVSSASVNLGESLTISATGTVSTAAYLNCPGFSDDSIDENEELWPNCSPRGVVGLDTTGAFHDVLTNDGEGVDDEGLELTAGTWMIVYKFTARNVDFIIFNPRNQAAQVIEEGPSAATTISGVWTAVVANTASVTFRGEDGTQSLSNVRVTAVRLA